MIQVKDLKQWLATLKDTDSVGVDEGGLTLQSCNVRAHVEVGGLPDEDESCGVCDGRGWILSGPNVLRCDTCNKFSTLAQAVEDVALLLTKDADIKAEPEPETLTLWGQIERQIGDDDPFDDGEPVKLYIGGDETVLKLYSLAILLGNGNLTAAERDNFIKLLKKVETLP